MTVLVIDDDEQIRTLMVDVLRDEGYRVDTAASVAEGLAKLARSTPELVLIDVRLGDGDGRQVVRYCRSEERLAGLPILIMTAAPGSDAEGDPPVAGFVPKPFEIDGLLAAIRSAEAARRKPDPRNGLS